MNRSTLPAAALLGATAQSFDELTEKMSKGAEAFKRIAAAAQADPEATAASVATVFDQAAAKRESIRRPGQRRRGPNFTAPSTAHKKAKAKRRAQGQARRK